MDTHYKGIAFYSRDLADAIGLAKRSTEEGPSVVLARADFHMADIARYNSKHLMLLRLHNLKEEARRYLLTQQLALDTETEANYEYTYDDCPF